MPAATEAKLVLAEEDALAVPNTGAASAVQMLWDLLIAPRWTEP